MSARRVSRGQVVGAKRERILAEHAAWLERREAARIGRPRYALEDWCRQTGRVWSRSNTNH